MKRCACVYSTIITGKMARGNFKIIIEKGEDILRFIEQTLRNESCKSDNIQLAEEASSCVMTMQLKLPVRRHVRVTAACLLLKCPCTASGSYHTFL